MNRRNWWPESESLGDNVTVEYERGTGGSLVHATGETYRTRDGYVVYISNGAIEIPMHRVVTVRAHEPPAPESTDRGSSQKVPAC